MKDEKSLTENTLLNIRVARIDGWMDGEMTDRQTNRVDSGVNESHAVVLSP